MAEPKKRLTSTRSGNRRSQLKLKTEKLSICSKCKSPTLSHRVCKNCGFYKSHDVMKLEQKAIGKTERRKEREKEEKAMSDESQTNQSAKSGSKEK